jgi:Acetyltransferase (GNAT) domain
VGLKFRILRSPEEWAQLRGSWDTIVESQSSSISGLDVTSTFTWAEALWDNHLGRTGLEVLVAESDNRIEALVPYHLGSKTVHLIRCRSLAPITELYSGRCGFLLREPRVEILEAVLNELREHMPSWDVFLFTLVEDSPSDLLLRELERRDGLGLEKISSQRSPYIVLDKPWEEYFVSLPRKFRWNLRNFEKKMKGAGEVSHRVFESGSDFDEFLSRMQEIEKASWKEEAGSSLTANPLQESFHARLLRAAADQGWFSGHVLEFRGEPVAYVYGLLYGNVFYDLKESYKSAHRDFGPGHVLKLSLMEQLFARHVAFYDYMGLCEEYKLRWTDKTYSRSTFLLYNRTLAARAARLSGRIKTRLRAFGSKPDPTLQPPSS